MRRYTRRCQLSNNPHKPVAARVAQCSRDRVKHLRASGKQSDRGGSLSGTLTILSIGHAKGAGRVLVCTNNLSRCLCTAVLLLKLLFHIQPSQTAQGLLFYHDAMGCTRYATHGTGREGALGLQHGSNPEGYHGLVCELQVGQSCAQPEPACASHTTVTRSCTDQHLHNRLIMELCPAKPNAHYCFRQLAYVGKLMW